MKPLGVQGYLLISFLFLSQFTCELSLYLQYDKKKIKIYLLRKPYLLLLPVKNKHEGLPMSRLE